MSPFDGHLINHFFPYYLKLGVHKFFVNFNTKFLEMEDDLQDIINKTLSAFGEHIKYNVGPNGVNTSEVSNIVMLQDLVNEHVNLPCDYVIPADSDEFHDYGMTLSEVTGASMTWKAEIITDTFNLANLEVKTPSAQPTAEQEQVSISC